MLEFWGAGVLECWVLEYWSAGVLEYWSAGVLDYWGAGGSSIAIELVLDSSGLRSCWASGCYAPATFLLESLCLPFS